MVVASKLWNGLPTPLRYADSVDSFKKAAEDCRLLKLLL